MFVFDIAKFTVTPVANAEQGQALADKIDGFFIQAQEDLNELSGFQLLKLFNATRADDVAEVKKFSDKATGVKRTWAQVKDLKAEAPKARTVTVKRASATRGGHDLKPLATVYPCKVGTKQSILIDMLARPQGATYDELRDALSGGKKPWADVTIRSGIGWDVHCVKGYGVTTEILTGAEAQARGKTDGPLYVMRLVYPEGMTAPLAHLPRKG